MKVPEDGLEDVPGPVLDRSLVHEQRVAILRQNKSDQYVNTELVIMA